MLFPTSLWAQWQILQICLKYDVIVIMQVANTGLTEGSTPNGNDYDRDIVILNTTKINKIHVIKDGEQVIALPWATLYETSGCAGKLVVFAVRLDTYEKNDKEQLFYIGTNDPDELSEIRKDILNNFQNLPILAEYMHKDIYDIAKKYGKDVFVIINLLGNRYLPSFFTLKGNMDAWSEKTGFFPKYFADKIMQLSCIFLPNLLPKKIEQYREKYDHYLMIKMANNGIDEAQKYFDDLFFNWKKQAWKFL